MIEAWRLDYNSLRPHSSLAGRTPQQFAAISVGARRLTPASGWRHREITELTWEEVDSEGGVIRLHPTRSKTGRGRVLPISAALRRVLERRAALRKPVDGCVFNRDGITRREWKKSWPLACGRAGLSGRRLHDCRRPLLAISSGLAFPSA